MAESATRAGYAVTSLDAFGDLDQHPAVRALSLPRDFGMAFTARAVAGVAESIESDAVVYLSPFENHTSALAALAHGRLLWGNPPAVVRRARDPNVLAELGEPWEALGSDRWLLKPRASGGGHGVRWWNPGDAVPTGWHVQRFVEGVPSSIVFVAAGGRAVPLAVTRQLIGDASFGASGFRYCGSVVIPSAGARVSGQGSCRDCPEAVIASEARDRDPRGRELVIPNEARDRDRPGRGAKLFDAAAALARAAARKLDLVGLNCIDFIDRDDVAVPIEINPRWSASMELVERGHGLSTFAAHASACTTGELPTIDITQPHATHNTVGKAILYARHDLVCGDTRAWLDDPTVRDVPHPHEHIPAGRPVCTVFAAGVRPDACYTALVERARAAYEVLESWSSVPA
jgi:predicted ATP-grasp superfamily ATP-dependent carboligase